MAGDVAGQLDNVGEVVLVPCVVLAGVRLEEVVPRGQLESHAGSGPDVRRSAVSSA